MANTKRLPAFEKFIEDMRFSWAELSDTEARMKRVQVLLEKLVNDPTMREHAKTWPSTEGHKNLLLYEDPDYNFVVNAVVRTPGRDGRIHDHAHAWTAYGVLDGTERLERYRRERNATMLIASHNMAEVERLCDRVIIMKRGHIEDDDTPVKLLARYGRRTLEEVFLDVARGRGIEREAMQ